MRPAYTLPENRLVERRARSRRRTLLAAKLAAGDLLITVNCRVRNLSDQGAQLELESPALIQPPIRLLMVRDGAIHEARLAWSWGKTLGVAFTATYDAAAAVPEDLLRLRAIWSALRA